MAAGVYVSVLDIFTTEFSPDSVEWCHAESYRDILACGTYKLNEGEKTSCKRNGKIYLLRLINEGKLELIQQIETLAILDMKWVCTGDIDNNQIYLCVVNSSGFLQMYQLTSENDETRLKFLTEEKVNMCHKDILALSLDCSIGRSCFLAPPLNLHIVASDSEGCISYFKWDETDSLQRISMWRGHEFESWCVSFDHHDDNIIYSGGDDNKFTVYDVRINSCASHTRMHSAGITSIHNNALSPFLLATGSYDHTLKLWDKRNFNQPTSQIAFQSGVWRIRWDPFKHEYLLVACMYGGYNLVDCRHGTIQSVIGHYNYGSQSLAYGCDWSFLTKEDLQRLSIRSGDNLVGTCFYQDCALCISAVNVNFNEE